MDKKEYETSLVLQSRKAAEVVDAVLSGFDEEEFIKKFPVKEIYDIQRIIITGCGDSWLAGIAMKPVFEGIAKIGTEAMRCIDFSRFLSSKMLGYSPNTPLVIGISVSGMVTRTAEALERATKYGANTIAITDNPDSPVGKAARFVVPINLPKDVEYGPGANSYNGILVVLLCIALKIARIREKISSDEYADMKKSISEYAHEVQEMMPEYDRRSLLLADKWKDLKAIDCIGDYADYATAYFCSAKIIETSGGYTTYDDSEDWCHINYFLAEPNKIGRVIVANKHTPSFGRIKETMKSINQLNSPCIVLTDANKEEFPDKFEVFTLPTPKYPWLDPLMEHYPFDILAGYISGMLKIPAFRTDMPEFNIEGKTDGSRIRNSKKVII